MIGTVFKLKFVATITPQDRDEYERVRRERKKVLRKCKGEWEEG